jgi:lysylphosphatidylglycerol synthetase-like protein (DUF2156 family)/UDP-2,3-diacylglucosamine pyrophosphatase LpxH
VTPTLLPTLLPTATLAGAGATATAPGPAVEVPDVVTVELPAEATALVCSDLHLRPVATAASRQVERDLADRLAGWTGPGALVLNGDAAELWGEPEGTVAGILAAHPTLTAAVRGFADVPGHEVLVVVGNHDAPIAFDGVSARAFAEQWGARCTLAVELAFDTAAGRRLVRCEHGHAFDPANAMRDPRDPLDSPLGQHVVQEVLPAVTGATPLLADLTDLADPNRAGQLLASRLVYRQLGRRAGWLLLPLLVALGLRIPVVVRAVSRSDELAHLQRWILLAGAGLLVDVGLVAGLAWFVARAVYAALAGSRLGPRGAHLNGAPRTAATALCADGYAGLVTGHTHQPELTAVPGGFYANSGCGLRCLDLRPARFGLPPVFAPVVRRSWVELDVQHDVRARLLTADTPDGTLTWPERLVLRRTWLPAAAAGGRGGAGALQVVAAVPGHAEWPVREPQLTARARRDRVRRKAAAAVVVVGLLGIVSALTPPLALRLRGLLELLPIELPEGAAAGLVVVGVAMLLLARGLRRGARAAWAVTLGMLATSAVLNLLKGIDVEETLLALGVAGWLVRHRAAFPVRPDARTLHRTTALAFATALGVLGLSTALVILTGQRGVAGESARETARGVAERLVGNGSLPLPFAVPFLTPALLALGICVLVAAGWLLTRPRLGDAPTPEQHRSDLARARELVHRHGGDTLAYFALRDDKRWFFTGDCVVAYAVRDGVCLVSPDPVGPPEQWAAAWAEFTAFAERHGWPVAVVGAGEGWLPIYTEAGMRPLYLGDEAIVDCSRFSLEGRPMKQLRSAHSRVRRAGFTVSFHDPAQVDPALADQLRELMTQSRRGDVERGFSMTLSRIFEPADTGLLLAVAQDAEGRVGAFCQYVPAADISGWSLDLMRRGNDPELPNGLIDFLVLETIQHLRKAGQWGLGLNFAVLRAVLAGEHGRATTDLERRVLHRLSDGTQMESLWRFNQKFFPYWRPRYVVLSGLTSAPAQGLAIAGAEGIDEIPVIGPLLARRRPAPVCAPPHHPAGIKVPVRFP